MVLMARIPGEAPARKTRAGSLDTPVGSLSQIYPQNTSSPPETYNTHFSFKTLK
jgi:hypothetical protein